MFLSEKILRFHSDSKNIFTVVKNYSPACHTQKEAPTLVILTGQSNCNLTPS